MTDAEHQSKTPQPERDKRPVNEAFPENGREQLTSRGITAPPNDPTDRSLRQSNILQMQRSLGNAAVTRLIQRTPRLASSGAGPSSQKIPQAQIEMPAVSDDTQALATRVVRSLDADPEDHSGKVIGLLASLDPLTRRAVLTIGRGQFSPQQQHSLQRIFAKMPSEKATPSTISPEGASHEVPSRHIEKQRQTETETGEQSSPTDRKTFASAITTPKQAQENRPTAVIPKPAAQVEPTPHTTPTSSIDTKIQLASPTRASAFATGDTRSNNSSLGDLTASASNGANHVRNGSTPNTPAAKPQVDTGSSEGLLESIASTPASSFVQAVSQSKGVATKIQAREKADLAAGFPEIDRPTGLPSIPQQQQPIATVIPTGQLPELETVGGRHEAPPDVKHQEPREPAPASHVPTDVAAPQNDGGGSWWNWLVNRVHTFLGSIPTHDTGLSTSAGSRPNVDLSGEADPTQTIHRQQASTQVVISSKATADEGITTHFGENAIYPTVPAERLKPTYKPSAPIGTKGTVTVKPPSVPEDMLASFNQHETPKLGALANEQVAQYRQQRAKYRHQSQETHQQGQQRIVQQTEQTRLEQQSVQQQVRSDVDAERQRWRKENRRIQERYVDQSQGKRQEIDRQIHEKVQSTEKETDQKFAEAEQKADRERQNTERQAADKKREVENKPHSFWDGVRDSISSVFDSFRQTVNGLFENLRHVVKTIIETVKTAVHTLIDAARTVVVGLIKGFGEFLKELASIAIAAFPAIAAKARAWIDKRVDTAVNAVNTAADKLKGATEGILDWVGETLDKALSVVQSAFDLILDGLEFLAKAPFEVMELLEKLAKTLKEYGAFIDGLQELLNNPAEIAAAAKQTLQGYIDQIPPKAHDVIQGAIQQLGGTAAVASTPASTSISVQRKEKEGADQKSPAPLQKHLAGIWRHLEPGLKHIQANWWAEIKKMVWDLVWPFNEKSPLWKDVPELIHLPGKILTSLWNGQFSQAVDQYLLFQQKINAIVGIFYGWFFVASVLVGTVIGAFFGGAGAIPGAAAGAAFAGSVGEGLLIAMVATETAVIGKAVFDLAFGSGTEQANESAYDRIASSGLTLGITAVFVALSAIASEIASELVSGIKGLFKGEVPEAPGVKVDAPEIKGDTPEVKPDLPEGKGETPKVKDLGTEGGEKVLAEETTPDGHKVKVTEDGECLICSDCAKLREEFARELANADPANQKLKADLDAADAMPDATPEQAQAKAKAEVEVRQKLRQQRIDHLSADPVKGVTPGGVAEAEAIMQAIEEGHLQGQPRRPNLSAGEPNMDFILEGKDGKISGYGDVKTPVDPSIRSLSKQVDNIAEKINLYGPNDKVIVDLRNIPSAEKATFKSDILAKLSDKNKVIFVNDK